MWRDILDYGRQLLELTQTTNRNSEEIKELRKELRPFTDVVQNLAYTMQSEVSLLRQEMQHLRESERAARENEMLRIENALLRSGRGLPPSEQS